MRRYGAPSSITAHWLVVLAGALRGTHLQIKQDDQPGATSGREQAVGCFRRNRGERLAREEGRRLTRLTIGACSYRRKGVIFCGRLAGDLGRDPATARATPPAFLR